MLSDVKLCSPRYPSDSSTSSHCRPWSQSSTPGTTDGGSVRHLFVTVPTELKTGPFFGVTSLTEKIWTTTLRQQSKVQELQIGIWLWGKKGTDVSTQEWHLSRLCTPFPEQNIRAELHRGTAEKNIHPPSWKTYNLQPGEVILWGACSCKSVRIIGQYIFLQRTLQRQVAKGL